MYVIIDSLFQFSFVKTEISTLTLDIKNHLKIISIFNNTSTACFSTQEVLINLLRSDLREQSYLITNSSAQMNLI